MADSLRACPPAVNQRMALYWEWVGEEGGGGYMILVACPWAEERGKSCFLAALALSAVH